MHSPRPEHWGIDRLGQLSKDCPGETLSCLWSRYEHAESPLYREHWWDHVVAVLRASLSSENMELKTEGIKLANVISAKGLQSHNLDELRALVKNV